jgi:hypothetical protein
VAPTTPQSNDGGAEAIERDNPTVPIGFDALRMWDHWPSLRLGTRTYMRSTYDRSGGNEGSDASHFLRVTSNRAVALDVRGTGVVTFERFNHWHGSPWHEIIDGNDTVVQETDTAMPDAPSPDSVFVPTGPFPALIAPTWSTTQGSDLIGVPLPFQRSFEIDYERTHYGTGYFIYQLFPEGARNLSQPIDTWAPSPPPKDVTDFIDQAGQDIAPTTPDVRTQVGTLALPAAGAITVFDATGPATLRAFKLTVPQPDAAALGAATLRVTWDDRAFPSIDAPVALFFGTGSLYNRASREFLVKALPVNVRFSADGVTLAVYFPMPFFRHAHVELVGAGIAVARVDWVARTQPYTGPTNWVGYFHATYADQGIPTPGVDLTLLDTRATEGNGDWCGQIVGTSFTFSDRADLGTLEGDPRMFFDDSQTPQVQGTGTEEWGGGGDYWEGGQTTTLPFYGHPVGAPNASSATGPEDEVESAYRFLLSDLMPFGKNARVELEHGGMDDSTEHYRTVAYWYGLPGACLVQTDALHIGDPVEEKAHAYVSATASTVDTLSTRYEWGVDHAGGAEIYPATQDTGRHMTGTSEFSLALSPSNFGVLLRRKLDYGYPDQRAEVYVADAGAADAPFAAAGTWYLAGSNSCVYSNPPDELSPIAPSIEASNRRWRDDEFLIPRALTDGRRAIRVRIVFSPGNGRVTPDASALPVAWSEFRYTAYVWTLPPPP